MKDKKPLARMKFLIALFSLGTVLSSCSGQSGAGADEFKSVMKNHETSIKSAVATYQAVSLTFFLGIGEEGSMSAGIEDLVSECKQTASELEALGNPPAEIASSVESTLSTLRACQTMSISSTETTLNSIEERVYFLYDNWNV